MISAETSALVAGGLRAPASQSPAPVAVRVLRAVMLDGQRVEPGTELDVDRWLAAELITAGKAERVTPTAPAAAPAPKPKEKQRAQQ